MRWIVVFLALALQASDPFARFATPRVSYATYFGGASEEFPTTVAVDGAGNIYVTGHTMSVDYPTRNAAQPRSGGLFDVFVTKFTASGTIVYSTYLGGAGQDTAYGVAVDPEGNAYVTGGTSSADFPKTPGVVSAAANGAFVVKLNAQGALVFSTVLALPNGVGFGITVDSNGNAYVAGLAPSATAITTGIQPGYGGGPRDAFLVRLNAAASQITYSTWLGGSSDDAASRVALDDEGNVYVLGFTDSANFPMSSGATPFPGAAGSFLIKLDPRSNRLLFSRFLGAIGGGGANAGNAFGLVVTSQGVYVGGRTQSAAVMTTSGAFQPAFAGGDGDGFLIALTPGGSVRFATYLGGSGSDRILGLAADRAGNIHASGFTTSVDFPVSQDAFRRALGGAGDGFVFQIDPIGARQFSSYAGGSGTDSCSGIGVDSLGNPLLVCNTTSSDIATAPDAAQARNAGGNDGLLLRLELIGPGEPRVLPNAVVNAASFTGGAVSPGEIVTLFPVNAGPSELALAQLTAERRVATLIGGTRVLFDNIAAPMIYAVAGQVSAVVPYGIAGQGSTRLQVEYQGVKSAAVVVPVLPAAPGIFTRGGGSGQAVVVQETGCCNSPDDRAARNSIAVLFATGEGQTSPPGQDGRLAEFSSLEEFPRPVLDLSLTVGGMPAEILYAGAAPGLVAGLLQINFRIPEGVAAGDAVPLLLTVGGLRSRAGVTMAIK